MSDTGNKPSETSIWILLFMAALGMLFFFNAGNDAADRDFAGMSVALVIGTFNMLLFLVIFVQEFRVFDRKLKAAQRDFDHKVEIIEREAKQATEEMADKAIEMLKELKEDFEQSRSHTELMEAGVHEAINQITGGDRPPTAEEVPAIQDKFHELVSDHYLKLEILPGGMSVEVSETPFESTTATATTTVGDAMDAVKPTKSKSQQRREAAMKTATKKG